MNYQNVTFLFFSSFLSIGHIFASITTEIEKQPNQKITQVPYNVEFDSEKYLQMENYSHIQPDFKEDVLSGGMKETLEICAGKGNALKDILKTQKLKSAYPSIHYTVVENSLENMTSIQKVYKSYSPPKKDNWLGCASKDVVDYLTTNLDKKRNKFDCVFAGFALHVLGKEKFIPTIKGLFDVMKEGGFLYITQHSLSGKTYDEEYIENVRQEKLLPFWVKDRFYSDPITMEKLLEVFGFDVIQCSLYVDTNLTLGCRTQYLGIIAQKVSDFYKEEKVKLYEAATLDSET
jgi:phospholipid N-methyltransferase